jgi:hypothetical protein
MLVFSAMVLTGEMFKHTVLTTLAFCIAFICTAVVTFFGWRATWNGELYCPLSTHCRH